MGVENEMLFSLKETENKPAGYPMSHSVLKIALVSFTLSACNPTEGGWLGLGALTVLLGTIVYGGYRSNIQRGREDMWRHVEHEVGADIHNRSKRNLLKEKVRDEILKGKMD